MIMYKLNEQSIQRLSDGASIPFAEGNRSYQQFLQDVKSEGISIVEGADVIEPDYVALRTGQEGYAPTGEQLDMQFNGTWEAHINDVKTKYPKTITGGTTVADIPDWVEVEVEALRFREQLQAYTQAVARLEAYVLADGREEVREMQDTTEYVVDDEGMIVVDDEGNPTFTQEEVVVISAIEPLEPTVEVTEYSDDPEAEPVTKTVENPEITQDNSERAEAQATVDATPQDVKDAS
jgi:hypothetical protein